MCFPTSTSGLVFHFVDLKTKFKTVEICKPWVLISISQIWLRETKKISVVLQNKKTESRVKPAKLDFPVKGIESLQYAELLSLLSPLSNLPNRGSVCLMKHTLIHISLRLYWLSLSYIQLEFLLPFCFVWLLFETKPSFSPIRSICPFLLSQSDVTSLSNLDPTPHLLIWYFPFSSKDLMYPNKGKRRRREASLVSLPCVCAWKWRACSNYIFCGGRCKRVELKSLPGNACGRLSRVLGLVFSSRLSWNDFNHVLFKSNQALPPTGGGGGEEQHIWNMMANGCMSVKPSAHVRAELTEQHGGVQPEACGFLLSADSRKADFTSLEPFLFDSSSLTCCDSNLLIISTQFPLDILVLSF